MKRKIVLHGPSTLTVSLPSKWANKFGIKKGDEIHLEERGSEINISIDRESIFESKKVDVKNLTRLGKTIVTSSFRQGYEELILDYSDKNYIQTIQEIISKETTGFEIVEQGKNSCVIRDLVGNSKDEFDLAFKRMWLLILDLSDECFTSIKNKDRSSLPTIVALDERINKLNNYCLRLLVRKTHFNFKKNPVYYYLVKRLEEIADQFKDLTLFYFEGNRKNDDKFVKSFSKINGHLSELYHLFYKYNEEKIEELFSKTKKTQSEILTIDGGFVCNLSLISRSIRSLISILIELNL